MKENKSTFEELLNDTFLALDFEAPNNEKLVQATADSVMGNSKIMGVSFGERLIEVLVSKWGAMGLIAIVFAVFFGFQNSSTVPAYTPRQKQFKAPVYTPSQEQLKVPAYKEKLIEPTEKNLLLPLPRKNTKLSAKKYIQTPLFAKDNQLPKDSVLATEGIKKEKLGVLPLITYEDMRKNKHAKEDLFKLVGKLSKRKLAIIEVEFQRDREKSRLNNFAMWKTEITNLEYRIFLKDLLIQKRYKDFYAADVVDEAWQTSFKAAYNEPLLVTYYFSHPLYDEYPVVNISRKGAELFCKWLMEGAKKFAKNPRLIQSIRLPTEQEWVYTASAGGKYEVFPWGTTETTNKWGNYLVNYKPEGDNFSSGKQHYYTTTKVIAYSPNDFGLYNMSGNVAEMVTYDENTIGTKGGSWLSEEDELKIKGKDPYINKKGAHPAIGFRPVVILGGRE